MDHIRQFLSSWVPGLPTTGLWVIETDDDQFLGTIEATEEQTFLVRSGFAGHPFTVAYDDITAIRPAAPPEVE